jgi:unsaturated rhamnogalacturonyl hydrolase
MAVLDVLDFVPPRLELRAALVDIARALVQPVRDYQDESGLWWQVVDHPHEAGNYRESSASAMFAYFLLKIARCGYIAGAEAAAARAAACKALDGVAALKVSTDGKGVLHLADTCGGCGLGKVPDAPGPYRDGSYRYYVTEKICADDFKGVGPLILAALEREE